MGGNTVGHGTRSRQRAPKFDATFGGNVDDAGFALRVVRSPQVLERKASYLVDFFHVCEYLAAASKTCDPGSPLLWTETQKSLLKNNEFVTVIENLALYLEAEAIESDKAPVRASLPLS